MRTGEIFDFKSGDANSIVEPRSELIVEPCSSRIEPCHAAHEKSHVAQLWFYFGNSYDI